MTIRGQLGQACDGLAAIRGALTEWANTLDNPTWTTRRYTGYDGGQIAVTGTYMGQSVTIWEGLTAGQLAEVGDAVRSAA
ncbi:hypothetical protein [Thermocatellispora tengchongensis]|uniref:hypothetical protein n=1 Tax=Thermocatellispora tengchongensis TaxID=1073253 RepID=UPI00362AF6EF